MKIKNIFTAGITALMIAGSTMTAMAGQWIANGSEWYYLNDDGSYATNQWVGNYYLGPQGIMLTNTWTPDGYFVGDDGEKDPSALKTADSSIYDIYELENGAYHTIVDLIVNSQYASLQEVYANVDSIYANYSDEVKNALKAQLKDTYEYWTAQNTKVANQSRPWTAEELAEDPGLAMFTREEVEAEMARLKSLGFQ